MGLNKSEALRERVTHPGDFWDWCCIVIDTATELLEADTIVGIETAEKFKGYIPLRNTAINNTQKFADIVNKSKVSMEDLNAIIKDCATDFAEICNWIRHLKSSKDDIHIIKRLHGQTSTLDAAFNYHLQYGKP